MREELFATWDSDEREELWVESVRRFNERAQAEMRHRWVDYHRHLQSLHQGLAAEHEEKAQRLAEGAA